MTVKQQKQTKPNTERKKAEGFGMLEREGQASSGSTKQSSNPIY